MSRKASVWRGVNARKVAQTKSRGPLTGDVCLHGSLRHYPSLTPVIDGAKAEKQSRGEVDPQEEHIIPSSYVSHGLTLGGVANLDDRDGCQRLGRAAWSGSKQPPNTPQKVMLDVSKKSIVTQGWSEKHTSALASTTHTVKLNRPERENVPRKGEYFQELADAYLGLPNPYREAKRLESIAYLYNTA
ncbi:hypothetical protein CISG_04187 [Coccidioides immitis RMSCC 3703]|uniref:Uncharacterized protein n=2 Tax=Coccidioides immitis TaxID=5501 RepID=A0A0J8QRC9_COCIT|nr:hypothetical protein CIRG_06552 [Coccidioides immitis RMSCC 2394]KMU75239.1 hypothetical protein CISG_04187 [Coccidioides immitis RMSCC 3703]